MTKRFLLALAVAALLPASGHAQSLFNSAGMGLPIEPLDARARARANLGIGLPNASLMPTDPAAAGRFILPTGVMSTQPSWVDYTAGADAGSFQGTRFPLIGIAYPLFDGMMTVQLGSFLDQHFNSQSAGSVAIGGEPVATTEIFDQNGSVSNLNIGYGRALNERFTVGASFGRYAGSVVRTLTRSFDDPTLGVEDYIERGKWSYTGHSATLGATADLGSIARLAASIQLPTRLEADADESTSGSDGSFDLPVQYRLGGTASLAPGLRVTASAAFADWSSIESDLREPTSVGDANGFGVGVELTRARLLGKDAPLRFGYRKTGLPFSFPSGAASERVFAAGFGLALNQTGEFLLAGSDFALERGKRSGGGVTEDFWRLTISVVVSGT